MTTALSKWAERQVHVATSYAIHALDTCAGACATVLALGGPPKWGYVPATADSEGAVDGRGDGGGEAAESQTGVVTQRPRFIEDGTTTLPADS